MGESKRGSQAIMKFRHVVEIVDTMAIESSRGVSLDKLDQFLSRFLVMTDEERERALAIRRSGVAYLFSLAAKGEFNKIAEELGLEEPPQSYAEALKIISEKKRLSELYRT